VVAAKDRLGLFSEIAGLLASHSVSVRSAVLSTSEGVAVNTWRVDKQVVSDLPDPAYLVKQLERLENGDSSMLQGVRRKEARALSSGSLAQPHVQLLQDASQSAVVVEVRAGDRAGLLYALGQSVTHAGLSIRSAHISTLAGQAIDTFYLTEPDGSRPSTQRGVQALQALAEAAGSPAVRADSPAIAPS